MSTVRSFLVKYPAVEMLLSRLDGGNAAAHAHRTAEIAPASPISAALRLRLAAAFVLLNPSPLPRRFPR
jgi:hypothetical protein